MIAKTSVSSFIKLIEFIGAECKKHNKKLTEEEQWVVYSEVYLSLDGKDVSDELAEKIALELESNKSLTSLGLCTINYLTVANSRFTPEGMKKIAEELKNNDTLSKLDICTV